LELRGLLIREQFGLYAALPWFEAGLQAAPNDIGLLGEYAEKETYCQYHRLGATPLLQLAAQPASLVVFNPPVR